MVPTLCVTSTGREDSKFRSSLFQQVLILLSVGHCLLPAGQAEPVFRYSHLSEAVRGNESQLHNPA